VKAGEGSRILSQEWPFEFGQNVTVTDVGGERVRQSPRNSISEATVRHETSRKLDDAPTEMD